MAELEWGFCHSLPDLAAKLEILLSPKEPTSAISQSKKVLSWQTQTTCVALKAFFALRQKSTLSLLPAGFVRCRIQAAFLDIVHLHKFFKGVKAFQICRKSGRQNKGPPSSPNYTCLNTNSLSLGMGRKGDGQLCAASMTKSLQVANSPRDKIPTGCKQSQSIPSKQCWENKAAIPSFPLNGTSLHLQDCPSGFLVCPPLWC